MCLAIDSPTEEWPATQVIFRHTHLFSLMCLGMSIRDYADYCIFMQWVCWHVNATYAEMESEEEPVPPVSCWRASW